MSTHNWIGKEKVVKHHLEVPFYTKEHRYGFRAGDGADKADASNKAEVQSGGLGQGSGHISGNMIIHGDNLMHLYLSALQYG